MQAVEAIKWLSGNAGEMRRTWVHLDLWRFALKEWRLPDPRESCVHCGMAVRESAGGEGSPEAVVLCGRDTVQVTLDRPVPLAECAERVRHSDGELIAANRYLVKWSVPDGERVVLFEDGRVLVQGTTDERRAIFLCRRYVMEGRGAACAE
jgi:hypothetical protein